MNVNDTQMTKLRDAAEEFLAQPRIAVAGVSRDPKQPANLIYRRLREAGHEVFAVNPNAEKVEGDRCYAAVTEIPDGVDGIVVVTPPQASAAVVEDCALAGVPRVWLHRGIGPGSVSEEAIETSRAHGIAVIPGGCPNMRGDLRPRSPWNAARAAGHRQDPAPRPLPGELETGSRARGLVTGATGASTAFESTARSARVTQTWRGPRSCNRPRCPSSRRRNRT